MPGSSSDGRKSFCAWHIRCLNSPRLIGDFVEFQAFLRSRKEPMDEVLKKAGIPLAGNPWRGESVRLWHLVGGDRADLDRTTGHDQKSAAASPDDEKDYLGMLADVAEQKRMDRD